MVKSGQESSGVVMSNQKWWNMVRSGQWWSRWSGMVSGGCGGTRIVPVSHKQGADCVNW